MFGFNRLRSAFVLIALFYCSTPFASVDVVWGQCNPPNVIAKCPENYYRDYEALQYMYFTSYYPQYSYSDIEFSYSEWESYGNTYRDVTATLALPNGDIVNFPSVVFSTAPCSSWESYPDFVPACKSEPVTCPDSGTLYSSGQSWDWQQYGDSPTVCAPYQSSTCLVSPSGRTRAGTVCAEIAGEFTCTSDFYHTGQSCSTGGNISAGGGYPSDGGSSGDADLDSIQRAIEEQSDAVEDRTLNGLITESNFAIADMVNSMVGQTNIALGTANIYAAMGLEALAELTTSTEDAENTATLTQAISDSADTIESAITNLPAGSGGGDNMDTVEAIEALSTAQQDQSNTQSLSDSITDSIETASATTSDTLNSIDDSLSGLLGESNGDGASINETLGGLSTADQDAQNTQQLEDAITGSLSTTNDLLSNIEAGLEAQQESEENTLTASACGTFTCDGDEIACFLAKQDFDRQCANEAVFETGGLADQIYTQLDDYISDEDYTSESLEAAQVDNIDDLMNKFVDSGGVDTGVYSGECPASIEVDAVIATFELDFSPFCELAVVIRWFLIAFASIGSAIMISKYV
ncbi:virulence factor TspB C-terminal domain-related protein [Vibrio sp. 10N.261.46.A3]|uniref:virulence factor TspB C-terminal domain-related protein n=1 Tax=Vibrio sp. 10N.261.46.A3 TaxID=3229658 RepID=UPI00354BB013